MAVPAGVRVLPLALACALLVPPVAARAGDDDGPRVDAVAFAAGAGAETGLRADALLRFYEAREYRPAWTKGAHLSRQGAALLRVLGDADGDGLSPQRYWHPVFDAKDAADPATLAEIELRLTDGLLRYASDAGQGRFDPAAANPYWAQRTPSVDAAAVLREAVESKDVAGTLEGLLPRNPQYAALRGALVRYRGLAEKGGWPTTLPVLPTLRPGHRRPDVVALRARLLSEGDMQGSVPAAKADIFDDTTSAALKRFQARHGLDPTGALDRPTVAALNVPVEERIRQIELNLERWRWLSPSLPDGRFVLVNIPAFELHGFDGGRPVLRMRVVTGNAARTPTPVFGRTMTEVVFRPYWNVPTSIAEAEIMPAVDRDRGYLRRRNMELVRGDGGVQLRQRPGPGNALGLVKFLLPNPFGVYLHDTPEDGLFARARRDRSHGCVRVERPFELARFALAGAPEWTPARIRAAAARGPEQPVALPEPLPVFITYLTAWADADGVTRFLPDVYEHDAEQERLLQ
jgi:L,D-transpeptidase YcbB